MRIPILLSLITTIFSVLSVSSAQDIQKKVQQSSKEKQYVSTDTAEIYFTEKKWKEALKEYERILPDLKGDDLEKANDRLGDINFFFGHYDKSIRYYKIAGEAVLARSVTLINRGSKYLDSGVYSKVLESQSLFNRSKVLNALSGLILNKMILVNALPTGDVDENAKPLIQEVRQKIGAYIFIYNEMLTEKGFNLNVNKFNAENHKLNKIKEDLEAIVKKFGKSVHKDTTKTK